MDSSDNRSRQDIIIDSEVRDMDFEIRQVSFQVRDIGSFLSRLRDLSTRYGVFIVCFNAELMAGQEHVISAISHAKRAMKKGTCISSSFEIEALLYAAGSRQCQDAAKFGVNLGLNNCYLCIYPVNPLVWSELQAVMTTTIEDWERMTDEKKNILISLFGIPS